MYIWQQAMWPKFTWDDAALSILLAQANKEQGRLKGKLEAMGFRTQDEALLQTLGRQLGVTLLAPHEIQCRDERCYFIDERESLFADSGHLARTALARFVPMFERGLAREP